MAYSGSPLKLFLKKLINVRKQEKVAKYRVGSSPLPFKHPTPF